MHGLGKILQRATVGAAVAAVAGLAAAPAATAAPSQTISFMKGGKGSAKWTAPDAEGDRAIALKVPDETSFAGVTLNSVPAELPASEPTFDFRSTITGGSGGSPRLDVFFEDGSVSSLRPLELTTGWTTVSGALWEQRAGDNDCTVTYNATYEQVQECHADDTVEAVQVVSDSGWLAPGGYTHYVDDITFGTTVISEPVTGRS